MKKNITVSKIISMAITLAAFVFIFMYWNKLFPGNDNKNNGGVCTEHSWGEWAIETEATCSKIGKRNRVCLECYTFEKEEIPKNDEHQFGAWEMTSEPSCIAGRLERSCTLCKRVEEKAVDPNGEHSYGKLTTVTEPTCGENGESKIVCKRCGDTKYSIIYPTGDHTFYGNSWITVREPTCGAQGEEKRACTECTVGFEARAIPSTSEHVFAEFGADCSVCGADYCTVGLEYTLADDEQSYILTGDGEVRDEEIVVPAYYRDLPVTEIGGAAFDHAGYLKRIHLPDSVTKIDSAAFRECYNLGGVRMSENSLLYSLGSSAFEGCDRLYFEIPETVKLIGQYCFRYTTLIQTVGNVSYVGNWAVEFKNTTDVTSVTVRDGTVGIGSGMKGQYLKTINLPDSVKYISGGAFSQCVNLKNITIPDGVEEIFGGTFSGCYALTEIVIPASIKRIGSSAFEDCRALTSVTFENSDGWKYNYDGHWRVIEEDLSDTSVAATALKRTYVNRELKIDE